MLWNSARCCGAATSASLRWRLTVAVLTTSKSGLAGLVDDARRRLRNNTRSLLVSAACGGPALATRNPLRTSGALPIPWR
jgi:hypothetical protein